MTVLARKQVGLLKLGFKTGPSQRGAVGASHSTNAQMVHFYVATKQTKISFLKAKWSTFDHKVDQNYRVFSNGVRD